MIWVKNKEFRLRFTTIKYNYVLRKNIFYKLGINGFKYFGIWEVVLSVRNAILFFMAFDFKICIIWKRLKIDFVFIKKFIF